MQTAHNVEFRRPLQGSRGGLVHDFHHVHGISVGVFLFFAKRTKLALILANVGIIDMAVNDIVCRVAVLPLPDVVSNKAYMKEIIRFEEPHAVFKA